MKAHYHWSIENVLFYSLTTALVWHGIRFLAGRAGGSQTPLVSRVGHATGGAFTFGGIS